MLFYTYLNGHRLPVLCQVVRCSPRRLNKDQKKEALMSTCQVDPSIEHYIPKPVMVRTLFSYTLLPKILYSLLSRERRIFLGCHS